MTWTRGQAAQYDSWSTLLEPEEAVVGWNWNNLFAYMKKVQASLLTSCFLNCSVDHVTTVGRNVLPAERPTTR